MQGKYNLEYFNFLIDTTGNPAQPYEQIKLCCKATATAEQQKFQNLASERRACVYRNFTA